MKCLLSILLIAAVAALTVGLLPTPTAAYTGYVVCNASDDIVPFDADTYAIGTAIPMPYTYPYPYDATMTSDTTEVWVVDASGDHVLVVDVATNTITHTIPVGEYPSSVVFTDDGSTALVSARDGDAVTLIKTSDYSVTGTLSVLTGAGGTYDGPGQMALDPRSRKIYAVDWYGDTLFEIDENASTVLRSVDIGEDLWQLVCDPNGAYIYVTDRGPDIVRVIDSTTLTEVTQLPVGSDPWGIDVSIEGAKLVVACEDDSNVYIFDTSDWSSTVIPLGAGADPRDVDILEDQKYAFVTGGEITGDDVVYVIELTDDTLKSSFPVGGNPSCIAVEPQMYSLTAGIGDGPIDAGLLLACRPNPFNPKTVISYSVPESCEVELAVFDPAGRRVATLEKGPVEAGDHTAAWSGMADDGHAVATGVYFVRLTALGGTSSVKAVLLK